MVAFVMPTWSPAWSVGPLTAAELLKGPLLYWLQDTGQYWQHRLFHTEWLFRNFHYVHHELKRPIAAYTNVLHPIEYIVVFYTWLIIPIWMVGPIHTIVFTSVQFVYFPIIAFFSHSDGWRWFTEHHQHHRHGKYNFSETSVFWDTIMGTIMNGEEAI